MPADVLEKPVTECETSSAATEAVGKRVQPAQPPISNLSESNPTSRRQRIGEHLRAVFEGHNEFLGWTPD